MPQIGEVRKAKELGRSGWHKYVWHACPNCGKERWVQLQTDKPFYENCLSCNIRQGSLKRLKYHECKGTIEHPVEGDIRRAFELVDSPVFSEHPKYIKKLYVWRVCSDCQTGKWIRTGSRFEKHTRCHKCATVRINRLLGKNKPNRRVLPSGYILIKLTSNHPFFCMANSDRYVFEHRLVMAQYLGRPLTKNEIVHHKNGNKSDNQIKNLELLTFSQHSTQKGYNKGFIQGYIEGFELGLRREASRQLLNGRSLRDIANMTAE